MAFSLSYLLSPRYHPVIQLSSALHLSCCFSPNSFSLSTLSPPPSLPMTLHKLRAIQVALVMLIGLAMAYAYPPSRVWALIRAKQSPAHPSCSTLHKYKHSAAYDVVLSLDPLSAGSFNVSNCPWACASQTRRLKFPLCSLNSSRCIRTLKSSPLSWTSLPLCSTGCVYLFK